MRERKLNRRDFLRLSMLAAGAPVLAACTTASAPTGQGGAATPAPAEATAAPAPAATTSAPPQTEAGTISYWTFWSQYANAVKVFQPILAEKVKPHTIDIKTGVNAEEVFLTAVAAGTPPDIGTGHHYIDYMSKGQAIPIDDFVATSSIIKEENFSPAAWRGQFYQGKQYGVSGIEAFVRRGLNYNIRLVQEAGLDPDKPPVTWPEMLDWHKKLTKFDSAGNLTQIGYDPTDAEGGLFATSDGSFIPDSWGFEWFDTKNRTFNIDNPMMVEGMETLAEFVKIIGPDNLAGLRSVEGQGTWGGSFNAEVQAMIVEGYWHPGETANEKPEVAKLNRATWIPVPESRRGAKVQQGGGHMVFLYKGAKNPPEWAWPVAEFLNTKEHCDPVFQTVGWLPDFKPYVATVDPSPYPGLDFYLNSVKEANEWHFPLWCEIETFVNTKYNEYFEKVYRGEMTAKDAAAALQKDAEQEWKEAGYAG
ncbi:MAG TPA: substrate-binding domain-containing protein [Roseiflexaceae bacterium]|nr:substrate-binding domain-containing protein [Roseiflexaceae bacterium]